MQKSVLTMCLMTMSCIVAGCYSLESAPIGSVRDSKLTVRAAGGEPAEHIVVTNNGWYLFNLWPVACGNATPGARLPWAFFRDDVDESILQDRLTSYAHARGFDIEEMNLFSDEQVLLSIPGSSIPIPIPYLATYRRKQFSGVLVKRPKPPAPDPHAQHHKEIERAVNRLLGTIPDGGTK